MKGAVLSPEVYQEYPVKPHGTKAIEYAGREEVSEPSDFANVCVL